MSLVIVKPLTITSAMLVSTTVPETDYPEWLATTNYHIGDRVQHTIHDHNIYECLVAGVKAVDPENDPTSWIKVSPTNRWKLFDTSNSTQTAKASSIQYVLAPGEAITAVSALNLTGCTSFRVRMTDPVYGLVYDQTTDFLGLPALSDWWTWFFGARTAKSTMLALDLPSFPSATVTIDLAGTTLLAVGVLLMGQQTSVGEGVEYGAKVGIVDYSRKETNTFGDTILVQRAFAKRANFSMKLRAREVDATQDFLASIRALPCLYIGTTQYGATAVFGKYDSFDIIIAYQDYSDCTMDILGLT